MSKSKSIYNKTGTKNKRTPILYLLPIMIIVSIVPMVVLLKHIELTGIMAKTWTSTVSDDFFSYYKMVLLLIFGAILTILMFINFKRNNLTIKKTIAYYPMISYAIFIILSAAFSKYPDIALKGSVERYEGTLVLLTYLLVTFAIINLINGEYELKVLTGAIIVSGAIIGLIGLFQFIGWDFFKSELGKLIIVPPVNAALRKTLEFPFPLHQVYSTLYNPNYVGSYVSLLLPMTVGLMLHFKKLYLKISMIILCGISIVCVLGSESRAGLIGIFISIMILLFLMRKKIIPNYKIFVLALACFLISIVGVNYVTNGSVYNRIMSLLPFGESSEINSKASNETKRIIFEDIRTNTNSMHVKTNIADLYLILNAKQVSFTDDKNQALAINVSDDNVITFTDKKYSDFKVIINKNNVASTIYIGGYNIPFYISDKGFKIVGTQGNLVDPEYPQKWGFEKNPAFASGRGYIWSRTIPLLKDTIFVGHGADTFTLYFPQNDFIGKLNGLSHATIFVDKPHNMYLQIAISTGIVSLICFFALLGIYIVSSFRIYFKRELSSFTEVIGVCCVSSVLGYCITGIANDSVISVAPVFWALLGMGICCNHLIKNKLFFKKS